VLTELSCERSESEGSTMAYNNNKGEHIFPYDIEDAEGEVKEQFIKDFHGE
jgi:hypothetical protein